MKYWFKFRFKDWLTSDKVNAMSYTQRGYYVEMLCKLHTLDNPAYFMYGDKKMSKKELQKFLLLPLKIFNFFIEKNHIKFDEKEQVYYQPKIKKEVGISDSKRIGAKAKWEKDAKQDAMQTGMQKSVSDSDSISLSNNKNNVLNNVGEFYEKNIGMLSPYVCDELKLLEDEHKEQNVIKALKLAVEAGAKSLRYVKAILDSEKVGDYQFKRVPKSTDEPLLKKLPPVIRKQVEQMIEQFIKNTGANPKEANIKLMIEKLTHEKVK